MAISTPSCFMSFASPNFPLNSLPSSRSISSSVGFGRPLVSATYSTAERASTATETDTISSFRNANSSSLYDVLGIQMGADIREVKSAYRRLARVLHPDVGSRDSSADEFMKVHSAYTTLADPARRADYDRSLSQRRMGSSSPIRSAGGYRGRSWETDQCW
ncbi:hypothetical protein L6452_08336 [Arctium lappa]|uniref:Uncharacterized protein n=1 Tax=Arctium lappa TaxID=4217 RepID=A0ACB9DH21_ARCLA|nr:hypothetical protein L6452_08336 [Arctium lappa]